MLRSIAHVVTLMSNLLTPNTFPINIRRQPHPTLIPYTTLFRSSGRCVKVAALLTGPRSRNFAVAVALVLPPVRSEEHTSELQSPCNLVCRLLLEKKNESISILEVMSSILNLNRSYSKAVRYR